MASQLSYRAKNYSYETQLRRSRLRRTLLETLDRRELLAADLAGPAFAPGTPQDYVDSMIAQFALRTPGNGEDGGSINLQGSRWSNPASGPSPGQGDPATVTWSIVPDGTIDQGDGNQATNLVAFMDNIYGGGSGPVAQRPWFNIFQKAYDRWSAVSGLTFVYEAKDDGAPIAAGNRGVLGVRGDVRIGGHNIDGNFGVLAYNYYPNSSGNSGFDGDMIIDTNDVFFFNVADGPGGENRGLFNVVMHESGHGIGLGHVIPINQTKLMEPNISFAFLGAQLDDILGANDLYGDDRENDDTLAVANNLGVLSNGQTKITGGSIDKAGDHDWFRFSIPSAGRISLTLEPLGAQYSVGPDGGVASSVNTLTNQNLELELTDGNSSVLAYLNATGSGQPEQLLNFDLPAAGNYRIRVIGVASAAADPQMYDLTVRMAGLTGANVVTQPPRLLSVAPNVGEIFSFNRTNQLLVAPNELVFRFDGAQFLDPASFNGIRITRSGYDDDFTDGDEVILTPGYIGFGDSERIIVARFASALPDDLYRVEIFGVDVAAAGVTAVRNLDGDKLRPRIEGTDRDTIFFNLELGNQIIAVVPQPTSRDATTNVISQARDQVEVYFNEGDKLYATDIATGALPTNPSVVDPNFYRLYADRGTVSNTDDVVFLPTKVEYFVNRNMARLTFATNIDQLDATQDTSFRLRVGTNEMQPSAPSVIAQPTDPGSTFNVSGAANLGVFSSITSQQVSEQIVNASAFPLDFPGAPDTPGSREILDDPQGAESHFLGDNPDFNTNLSIQLYNFNKVDPIGVNIFGNPIFSSISPQQEQRAREVFELYGSYLGIQFVESVNQGWTIGTADIDGVSGAIGVAGGGTAIMDAAESWNDEFGANDDPTKFSWFIVAMHEIGHLLGLGHSTELPPGTVLGGFYSNVTLGGEPALLSGNPVEPVFPGATDLVNGKYLFRPDSRDIDMYRFEVAPGKSGEFTATIVAERLPNSSLLDTVLTLYRERADGSREIIAVNDDYFSEDSFLKLDLEPGIYFIGVSASGNKDYDPTITDSGLGGTSEGAYQLKTTFRPLVASSIVDVKGSALDGDADGAAGGVFNFWFNAAAPNGETAGQRRTLFVDKLTGSTSGNGSRATPYNTIKDAFAAALPGDIVRIVPNGGSDGLVSTVGDNLAFEVGTGGLGNQPLADGATMNVPKGVTVVVDAGVLFKMGRSTIGVGSSTSSGDRSRANLQVLGTPQQQVFFTSYTDETQGVDTDPLSTTARAGDWGGIIFRNALDRAEGRFDGELQGRFLNYVGFANMQFGGGQVPVDGQNTVITPLHMVSARPTLINNIITSSAFAAVSADPNSFEETTFAAPRYQANGLFTPDYSRIGPEIHGNTLTGNSINGLFVRVETLSGQTTTAQTVAAHWDDRDIVHVIADTLTVAGTPGGPLFETVPPQLNVVNIASGGSVAGGTLIPGSNYRYRMTFVDANGIEGVASAATQAFTVPAGANAIRLSNLPPAGSSFVSRKIYRSDNNGIFRLVAEIDKSSTVYVDSAVQLGAVLNTSATLNRARLDANLVIDPGMIVKLQGGRIVAGISAQLVAEGQADLPVIFTSRQDDRFGAGGTFDTNSDGGNTLPIPGDWGGLYFGQAGSGSLDHARVMFGGGVTGVAGTFAGFNAVEIHQSDVRITNSIFENNASGVGGPATPTRSGFGFNESAAIFVRGSEPTIVNNIIRENAAAAISIDPQSMSGNSVKDHGRTTGLADRFAAITENKGPLLRGNALGQNNVNAMVIRGATLTTESVWDDADIVHAVFDQILVPDLYVFGGLRLQSSPNESLVVKFGPGAGLTSNGRPLDIDDRIGGTLQVIGTPGFPVVLTSILDDSIGAGFDPEGRAQTDTNNDTNSTIPSAGNWRSIRIDEFSNDRNVAIVTELEPAQSTGAGVNSVPSNAQLIGNLAPSEKSSDDNLRLGFTVVGAINNVDDIDVYSFQGTAGTQVWLDIDRTNISLDAVLELVDSDGNIIAQSDNSLDESRGALALFSNPAAIETTQVNAMQTSPTEPRNGGSGQAVLNNTFADFYSTNPLDPAMRLVLPGANGSRNTYFVRVRSSNIDSRDPAAVRADLQNPSKLGAGKTEGQYQLQIRLRQMDEFAGSSISYADVRFATTGIEVLGGPSHSPLIGEAVELATNNNTLANALNLGNLLNTDRAALSVAGDLNSPQDIDWYRFDINQDSIQSSGLVQHLSTIIDVDYADGLGRANTSLWLFYDDQNGIGGGTNTGIRLVNFGTDSNIADDIGAPLNGSDTDDLSRGTAGVLDAFIGSSALPSGTYYLAITSNELISSYLSQFYSPDAGGNPLVRVEPVNSVTRIAEDRFGGSTTVPTLSVGFTGTANQVAYTLADVPLLITQPGPGDTSRLITVSTMTGAQTSLVSQFPYVEDAAIRGDGKLHGARSPQVGVINDANSGGILEIDTAGNGATAARTGGSGIQTFDLDRTANPPTVASAFSSNGQRNGAGMEFLGLAYPQIGNAQFLYGVGSRADGSTTFDAGTPRDSRNYVYKLDPTSLAATSAPQTDRQNNARVNGAGTQIVERGYIDTSRDVSQNATYQNIIMAAASPTNAPSLLDGDKVTVQTANGTFVFEWTAAQLSGTLIADTSPQSQVNNNPPVPTNFFKDGETFTITAGAITRTFEIDSGRVLVNNYTTQPAATTYDTSTFTITDSNGLIVTYEFDGGGGITVPAGSNTRAVVYDAVNASQFQVSQAIVNAINNTVVAAAPLPWAARAALLPGTNRISITGDTSVVIGRFDPAPVATGGTWTSSPGSNPLTISTLTATAGLGVGQTYDGATFTLTDMAGTVRTFEFDTNASFTAGNVPVVITDLLSSNNIALAVQSAINFPTPAPPPPALNVQAGAPAGSTIRLAGDRVVAITPSTATVVNPLFSTPEYGLVNPASGNDSVAIEEYYTNLNNTQLLPIPSTPGAMPILVAAINATGMGVTSSSIGTRLVLGGATAANFTTIDSITSNTSTGTNIPLPFGFNDSAGQLNTTLFNAILAVEPLAQRMNDGRIWLPASSSFIQNGTDDRLDFPSKNAQFSTPTYGYVTGIAFAGSTMYGVSENGDLYRVGGTTFQQNLSNNNGDFIETIYNTSTGNRVNFVGLTSGPRNVEGGSLANILFGIDRFGVLYAFDTQGKPASVFDNAAWFIQTEASSPSGLAFSTMDVNLWHESQNRSNDPGHGVNVAFDGSRRAQQNGGRSLYFGFENPTGNATYKQVGNWTGVNDPGASFPGYDATIYNSYDFPTGTAGSIVSNTLDLSDYSPTDKPMLYFNYYLQTENANANNPTDTNYMRDAFRVFVAGDDGAWQLLGTNNSDFDAQRNTGVQDELDYPFLVDPNNALSRQVSELYDAGVNGAPDSWRQARVDLSRFAGDKLVRIRFDFSTSASMDVGTTGGVELVAVSGDKIREKQNFTISGTVFEFDLGLVLQIPTGAGLTAGQQFDVDGVRYTFSTTSNVGLNVQFGVNDSADQIAARIAAKIQAQGLSAFIDPTTPSRISVINAVATNPFRSATLPANFFSDTPGVTAGRESVLIHSAMTAIEVRDAMRTSIARRFNAPGQASNINVVRFSGPSIFLFNKTVTLPAVGSALRPPLGLSTTLQGDEFGESNSGITTTVGRGALQGQNNRFEGVYVDDIVIGFAERGEMVTYQNHSTPPVTSFVDNPRHEPAPGYDEIETGTYQIEIRRGASYGTGGPTFPSFGAYTSFDTNDRHAQQVSLIAPFGAQLADGQTFQLSDGIDTVTFEYDDASITAGPNLGVAQGSVRIAFTSLDSAETIALRIRDTINGPQSRAVLDIVAGLSDSTAVGNSTLSKTTGSRVVNLHGTVASNNAGGASFAGTKQLTVSAANQVGFVLFGVDSFKPTEIGDSNRLREQGQILIQNNIVRDSSNYGIVVDAGARINGALIPLAGALPHPGSVRNLVQFNQEGLFPGPVLVNNLIYAGAVGGILFSGDNRTATTPQAPTPFGRIINNTIVGTNGTGIGINVTDNASPTLLNNIVASLATGIRIDGTSTTTVVGATTYQSNGQNSTGSLGTNAQQLTPTEPLFVNAAARNYYLAAGTRAIDASIDSLNDRQAMTTVRDPLGIAVSPILAPEVDLTGQLRVDDPNISNPNGTGGNPFKDRGAYDRADFFGPIAVIQQPLDNDPDKNDVDRTNTYIQLKSGSFQALDFFSILLFEAEGTGPAANTVTSSAVVLTENGRLLTEGTDYIFGYNPSSRLIRLTPLAGIWRNDSVYEITLNNRAGIRVFAPDGLTLADGDTFNVVAGTTTLTFEFDSNASVATTSIAIPFQKSFSRYDVAAQMAAAINRAGNGLGAYIQGDRALMVTGATSISNLTTLSVQAIADVAGNQLQPNRISSLTQYTIVMPEVEFDFGDAPQAGHFTVTTDSLGERSINASRHAILPVDAPVLKLGSFVDGETDGQPNAAATGDDSATAVISSTIPGATIAISGGALVRTQAATAAINGQNFTIVDPTLQSVTFEFDTDPNPGLVTAGSVRIAVNIGDTAAAVANALRNAVTQAVLAGQIEGLSAFVSNDVVDLGGSSQFVFDFSAAASLTRLGQSEFSFTLPSTGLADGQVVSVTDTLGRTVLFELEDLSAATAGVTVGRVPVAVSLSTASATDVAKAFAAAINLEIAARRLSLAPVVVTGRSLLIAGDDEDGVSFGGLFNANSKPVPVTVTTQGSGILDVWFDWNGDGDFSDAGEHSISNLPVVSGPTKLLFDTPTIAQTTAIAFQNANPGQRFFVANRYRVSTNGTPLIGGVGIGGEVEDYMVEIVVGTPPIAVDDQYAMLEDGSLSVPATGILSNDIDPEHTSSQLRVVDEDPATPVIDPVKGVDHGVLTLRADGSFDYVPSRDFYGKDTFVYNATDPRLLSQFPATVTITVHPVNDAPTAFDDQLTIFEDESIVRAGSTFTLNDFKGTFGQASQINELGQNLTVVGAVITHPDPLVFGGSVSLAGNVLTFTPAAHYNSQIDGPITLTLTIQDDGQTADPLNGYALKNDFLTATSKLTIHVLPLNDSPNFAIPAIVNVDEDAGLQTINPFATNIVPGASRATDEATGPGTAPENQTVSFATRALNPSLFASAPSINASGVLTYQLNPDVTSQSPFPSQILVEVIAIDTGSRGSVVTNSFDGTQVLPGTLKTYDGTKLTVTDIFGNVVVFEFDDLATPGVGSTGGFPHVAIPYNPAIDTPDTIAQKLVAAISNPPAAAIKPGTNNWAAKAFVDAVTKEIRITSETSAVVTIGASLSPISVRQANTSVPRTFTIVPAAINDAPVFDFQIDPIVVLEDQGSILRPGFVLNAKPGPSTALDELLSQGLTLTVTALDPSAFLTQPSVTFDALTGTGTLTFQTNPDVNNATGHDLRIRVTLMDTGGVNRAGDVDTTIKTLTVSVTPVNDAPIFILPTTSITVLEDNESFTGVTPTTFVGFATNASGIGMPVQGPVTAIDETTLSATKQTLTFTTVSVSNPSLFAQLPTLTATGDLRFTTAKDKNGTAIVVVRLNDDGPGAETGNNDVNQAVADRTFTINITPVNDAPEFTIPLTVNSVEDQGLVQIPNFASDLRPGPTTAADEVGQEFTVTVQAIDPSKFTIQPAIAADGTLTFQTAPNVNSLNANLNVRVFLTDNGASGPAPNSNTSVTKTFTILTQAINDAPSFQLTVNEVSVIEDVEAFLGTSISTYANLATAIVPGPASATDEAGQLLSFEVVSVSAPELFSIAPVISPLGELSFKTASNKNGKAIVVVRLVDDGLGSPPPNVRNSSLQTFTISITPINDAPEFQLPTVITIDEDAGLISRNGFANNVRRGPIGTDDENSQLINFEVFAVDPSSFTVQPSIAPDGTLVFQTAPNVNSLNANLAVRARLIDNGASSPIPNSNASATQTFTILVNPVNDPPIADPFTVTGSEDATITILAADVLVGDRPGPTADEDNQTLTMTQIERTSLNGGTITPVMNGNEIVSFTYTPPANLVGMDTFLYVITDNGSPARSGSGTITILLAGINDPPQFSKGPNQVVPEDSPLIAVNNWATNILAGPPVATDEHDTQTVSFTTTTNNQALFEVQPSVNANGTLSFKPSKDANGTAVVTVIAIDSGSNVSPNVNTSAPQTFTITVNPVNDAPVFTAGGNIAVAEDSGPFAQAWATSIAPAQGLLTTPPTATDEIAQIVDFSVAANPPELFSVQPIVTSSGQLLFTPARDATGTAIVTVMAVDRGANGGLDVNSSTPVTFTVTISPVNDAPKAVGNNYTTNENQILAVAGPGLLANDEDVDLPNDKLSAVSQTTISNLGAVVVISADGSFSYDPSQVTSIQQLTTGQNVLDSFTYQIRDLAGLLSNLATVTINVAGIDDPPVAVKDDYNIGVGQTQLLDVLSNDFDVDSPIDPRTIVITTIPIFGTVKVNQTGVIEYTAGAGFRGIDTLGYTVKDAAGHVSNEALVTITVNNPPVAVGDTTFTFKNESVDINVLANDSDPDGTLNENSVQVVVLPTPSGTAVVLAGGIIRFTPATNFFGDVQFSYVVADDNGTTSNVADVLVRVQRSKFQNPKGSLDVNNDGFVSPIDALIIINYLNGGGSSNLPTSGLTPPPFLDVSGDESASPLDALLIINFLNQSSVRSGEGEAPMGGEELVMSVTPQQIIQTVGPQIVREIRAALDETAATVYDEWTLDSKSSPMGVSQLSDDPHGPAIEHALYCDWHDIQTSTDEEAVDAFFSDIGPKLPK